ncbi:MAG: dephospho-CoA kinase [Actinomycetota bacterium]
MFVIGITGGIASGKSTLTEYLKPSADAIIDADEIAREVVTPGTPAYSALVERFGRSILESDGTINRPELGKIIFSEAENIEFINGLTHPSIAERIQSDLKKAEAKVPQDGLVLLRIPLMVEAGLAGLADMIVVVMADRKTRIWRLVERRGSTENDAQRVIEAQLPDAERAKIADFVIVNDGSLETLAKAAQSVLAEARRRQKEKSG